MQSIFQSSKQYRKGFTLLEAIWGLCITAIVLWTIQTSWQLICQNYLQAATDRTADFHQTLLLISKELTHFKIENIQTDRILLQDKETEQIYKIAVQNHKIYKSPGHHPMMYGVNSWQISVDDDLLALEIKCDNGQIFTGNIWLPVENQWEETILDADY